MTGLVLGPGKDSRERRRAIVEYPSERWRPNAGYLSRSFELEDGQVFLVLDCGLHFGIFRFCL
jgi:hypothetical protein